MDILSTPTSNGKERPAGSGHACRLLCPKVMVLLCLMGLPPPLSAQSASEYEVKAAFLYKFANFVEWPPDSVNGPLCIAVWGEDPFGGALDDVVKGKSINGKTFLVRRVKAGMDAIRCQIVYISASEKFRLRPILAALQGTTTLTVSDIPGFCADGGVIEFELHDQRVHFLINPDAGERARLKLSSRLLSVAKIVRERRP